MYKLGNKSKRILATVDPQLQRVVNRAIEISSMDFTVLSGKRSIEEQRELVRKGASKTMKSKHVEGRAVDLVPYINGQLSWGWNDFYPIAEAMVAAARELRIPIRWGGCWDYINDKQGNPRQWVKDYVDYRKSLGKSAFIDAPHFDLG